MAFLQANLKSCCSSSSVRFAELADSLARRKGARAAEWDGLENRCGFVPTVGSNPTPSAITAHLRTARASAFVAHERNAE